jgi:NAD(P)-dependent dehydrogenase (short-subunit alcohol dehydrogenase family)
MCGATVVLACRSEVKARKVAKEIEEMSSNGKVDVIELDLSSINSIYKFSEVFHSRYNSLDILVNNGGLNTPGVIQYGSRTLQQLFMVNYFGHYCLFRCLEDLLMNPSTQTSSCPSRVVNLSSVTHHTGQSDFRLSSTYGCEETNTSHSSIFLRLLSAFVGSKSISAYSDSKLYLNLLTMEINRRFGGIGSSDENETKSKNTKRRAIVALSVNPGAVRSDIWR